MPKNVGGGYQKGVTSGREEQPAQEIPKRLVEAKTVEDRVGYLTVIAEELEPEARTWMAPYVRGYDKRLKFLDDSFSGSQL